MTTYIFVHTVMSENLQGRRVAILFKFFCTVGSSHIMSVAALCCMQLNENWLPGKQLQQTRHENTAIFTFCMAKIEWWPSAKTSFMSTLGFQKNHTALQNWLKSTVLESIKPVWTERVRIQYHKKMIVYYLENTLGEVKLCQFKSLSQKARP